MKSRGRFCHKQLRELYEADFHKPGSMEACVYGLTRGMCLVARRLDVVAVAGLLWISWCVLGGVDFLLFCVFFRFFFFERTRPTASMRPSCLIYISTSTEARPRERIDRSRVLPSGKMPVHTGVRTGWHYFVSLSVCPSVCLSVLCVCRCMCNIRRSD